MLKLVKVTKHYVITSPGLQLDTPALAKRMSENELGKDEKKITSRKRRCPSRVVTAALSLALPSLSAWSLQVPQGNLTAVRTRALNC